MSALLSSLLYPLSHGFWLGFETPGLPVACIAGESNRVKSINCIVVAEDQYSPLIHNECQIQVEMLHYYTD